MRQKSCIILVGVIFCAACWLDGYMKGKLVMQARMTDADQIVMQSADWLTTLQIAEARQ